MLKILVLLAFAGANDLPKHTEHFVQLGDSWSVECDTPFMEPPSWFFMNAAGTYNYYISIAGKIVENTKTRYNFTSSKDKRTSSLEISKTDKDHAGFYGCWPDAATLEGRQYYNLIIIEFSNIEFILNMHRHLALNMNISYLGYQQLIPRFKCLFSFGEQTMRDQVCKMYTAETTVCKYRKIFDLSYYVPIKCEIVFNNVNFRRWREQIAKIEPGTEVMVVKKGKSWNIRCETPSYQSMMWLYQSFKSNNRSITLYTNWTPNKEYNDSYLFSVSREKNVYELMIPIVNLDHAGSYMCAHKSSEYLVERKIDLLVVDRLSIARTTNHLIIITNYIGNNMIFPKVNCISNNQKLFTKHLECRLDFNMSTRCQSVESFDNSEDVPENCQIWFQEQFFDDANITLEYESLPDDKNQKMIHVVIFPTIVAFILSLSVWVSIRLRYCKRATRKANDRVQLKQSKTSIKSDVCCDIISPQAINSEQKQNSFADVEKALKQQIPDDFWPLFFRNLIDQGLLNVEHLKKLKEDQSCIRECKNSIELTIEQDDSIMDDYSRCTEFNGFLYYWSKLRASNGYYDVKSLCCDDVEREQLKCDSEVSPIMVKEITVWYSLLSICKSIKGIQVTYNSKTTYDHGNMLETPNSSFTVSLTENEYINTVEYRSDKSTISSLTFRTNLGKTFGLYDGEEGPGGVSKPVQPGGFLAGIRTKSYGRDCPDVLSSIEFCWGYESNNLKRKID